MYKEESKMENAILIPANMLQFSMEPQMARPNNLVELGKKLLESSQNGDTDEVRLLMSRGAPFTTDWGIAFQLGTSPLHMAAMNGHLATCEILLRSGISRDARTKVDKTPLHIAAQEGHTDIVELLLDNGADVDCQDLLRMTPLHWAVEREHIETIKVLLQHGANPNCVSKFEKTAFRIAMENNRSDLVELLQNVLPNSTNSTAQDERQSVAMEMTEIHDVTHQEEVETSDIKEDEGSSDSSHPRMQRVYLQASDLLRTAQEGSKEETDTHNTSTLQLLQAHGITMLPADDHTLVASAVKSGQTVVLTEAGKMALNLMADASHNSLEPPRKKMITIRTGAGPGGRTPNILKRAAPITDKSPTKVLLRTAPKPLETTISSNSSDDLAEIKRQLEEAQREANAYRVLLSRKEREAEQYRQQLQSITQKIQ